jgi:hypothetical protein
MVKESDMNRDTLKQYIEEQQQERIESYKQQAQLGAKANEQQVGGAHYAVKAIQPWDYIIANDLGYLEGNIVKYVSRWKDKGGVQDLKKAQHYLQKLIEVTEKDNGR